MVKLSICAGSKTVSDVEVTVVGEGLFRLDEEPLLCLAAESEDEIDLYPRFGDTVYAERINAETIRYVGVCERGPYRHYDFVLSEDVVESPALSEFLSKVVHEGGRWERHMGGLLVLSLPNTSALDPNDCIAKVHSGA